MIEKGISLSLLSFFLASDGDAAARGVALSALGSGIGSLCRAPASDTFRACVSATCHLFCLRPPRSAPLCPGLPHLPRLASRPHRLRCCCKLIPSYTYRSRRRRPLTQPLLVVSSFASLRRGLPQICRLVLRPLVRRRQSFWKLSEVGFGCGFGFGLWQSLVFIYSFRGCWGFVVRTALPRRD